MSILVIAEHDNAVLKAATLHAVTAARLCGTVVHVMVAGHQAAGVAEAAAAIAGVDKVWLADAPHFAAQLPENIAEQVLALARNYTHILAPATSFGKSTMPRVAATLDVGQISEICKVVSPDTFERPVYAGNAIATVQSHDGIKVVTVRTTHFEPAGAGGQAIVERINPVPDTGKSALVSRDLAVSARPELASAKVIVAGGRGLGSADNFKLLEALADKLGGAIGASRAAVDAGFAANDLQVGQTGKVVAPGLYIAVGISGAIQHLAGMKDAKTIVAINKDPEAPIFSVADYGIVGDLFDVVPQLTHSIG